MSINDLLESESTIPVLVFGLVIFFFFLMIMLAKGTGKAEEIYEGYDEEDEVVRASARIIDRRSEKNAFAENGAVNKIVFEFEDGNRIELAVKDASVMVVGDKGILEYRGHKFIKFEREKHNTEQG